MRWADIASRLRQCSDRSEAKRLHLMLSEAHHDRKNTFIGNLVVKMYGDCGLVRDAWGAFESIEQRNIYSWNIMLTAYSNCAQFHQAMEIFHRYPSRDVFAWNMMISLHSRLREIEKLREHFDRMPERNVSSWNALLTANANNGHLQGAIEAFNKMPFVVVLTWNAMLSAYADKSRIVEARNVFYIMEERDPTSWNAMVAAFAANGHPEEAKLVLELMPEQSQISWNAVITAHSSTGNLDDARALFDNAPERNSVSWSTLVSGYARHGQCWNALQLFKYMDLEGIRGDNITLISVFYACATISAVNEGRILYEMAEEDGLVQDVPLANNMINMFARCGSLESARVVFDQMGVRDPLAWNTMITAYSKAGETSAAFQLYHTMILVGIQPVYVTFVSILSSCSHAGLLKNSQEYFHDMSEEFGIAPGYDHYRCMIDVLGRVGQLERAEELINTMPYKADAVIWNTFLGACKNHRDSDLAARAGLRVIQLDPHVRSSYVLLSNAIVQVVQADVAQE